MVVFNTEMNKNVINNCMFCFLQESLETKMRHNPLCCETPPTVTVHVKSGSNRSHQPKNLINLKRPIFKDSWPASEKNVHNNNKYKCSKGPCLVIQRQEMTAFFKLFGRSKM